MKKARSNRRSGHAHKTSFSSWFRAPSSSPTWTWRTCRRQHSPAGHCQAVSTGPWLAPSLPALSPRRPMLFLIFSSNFLLIFGKLWEVRSKLYRRQILQINTRLKALAEIHNIYTLLHLWNPIETPWKALRASVLRTKHTAPEKKLSDRSSEAWGSSEKRVHTGTLL